MQIVAGLQWVMRCAVALAIVMACGGKTRRPEAPDAEHVCAASADVTGEWRGTLALMTPGPPLGTNLRLQVSRRSEGVLDIVGATWDGAICFSLGCNKPLLTMRGTIACGRVEATFPGKIGRMTGRLVGAPEPHIEDGVLDVVLGGRRHDGVWTATRAISPTGTTGR